MCNRFFETGFSSFFGDFCLKSFLMQGNRNKSQSWTFFEYTPCTVLPGICKIERSSGASGCTQTRFEYVPYFVLSDKNEHCFFNSFQRKILPCAFTGLYWTKRDWTSMLWQCSAQCFGKPLFFPVLILTNFWSDFCAFSFFRETATD